MEPIKSKSHGVMPSWIKGSADYSLAWNNVYVYDRNYMCAFCGSPGLGKSTSAIKAAWDLDRDYQGKPRFSLDNVVWTPEEFLLKINSDLPHGTVIVWDEVGVGINTREWYSMTNRLISKVHQLFRHKCFIVFYTVPSFDYVDSQVRKLFHAKYEMKYVNPVTQRAEGVFFQLKDMGGSEPWAIRLRVNRSDRFPNWKSIVTKISFALPPTSIVKAYKAKKELISADWYSIYSEQMKVMKKQLDDRTNIKLDMNALYNRALACINELWKANRRDRVDAGRIRMKLKIGEAPSKQLAKMINDDLAAGKIAGGAPPLTI